MSCLPACVGGCVFIGISPYETGLHILFVLSVIHHCVCLFDFSYAYAETYAYIYIYMFILCDYTGKDLRSTEIDNFDYNFLP